MTQKTFHDVGIDPSLADALAADGITNPFPIQEIALPVALKGADVIGQARTGTGKTLAFGLPLLQRIDPSIDRTQALVIVPTRELGLQVAEDLALGAARGVRVAAVYGGVGYEDQVEALTSGVHVVVGTPGRLLDHLNRGNLDLTAVTELVLDEADEMLDMGFLPDVERLIEACADDRHTMLFSATMPTAVVKLARRYMRHPTFLRADTEEHEVAPTVEQHFFLVHRLDKPRVLARVLQTPRRGACYVFVRTKHMADRLVSELENLGVDAIAIHGDLRQATRERNLDRFRDGKVDVLVATEVAARGLDVENVTHVVNYDCPDDEKMYLHRIGRTARAGAEGVAITFAEFNEVDRLNMIRKAVDADREIVEAFSTSDLLTSEFDLPSETPWSHLGRGAERGEKRASRTDGRSKNRRSSEGRGGDRDADRDRRSRGGGKRDDRGGGRDGGKRDRRAEGRDGAARRGGQERGAPEASEGREKTARADGAAVKDDRAKEVRVRSRSVERADDTSDKRDERPSDGGERRRGDGGSQRAERRSADDDRSRTSSSKRRARQRADGEETPPARGHRRTARSRSEREGRGGGTDRRGGRSSRGSQRGEGSTSPETPAPPAEEPTPPGESARGEGRPQLARRVRVEHLP